MRKLFNWRKKEQSKAENPLPSTGTNTGNSASQEQVNQLNTSSPLTCKNLLLPEFIEAYCNDNLAPLFALIPGTEKDKHWRWAVILEEWSWLMKNEDGKHLFELMKKIYILKTHIIAVDYCTAYLLSQGYDKEVADKLCEVYHNDYSKKENVNRALVMVDTKRYELEILVDEYARLQKNNGGEKTTEADFNANIARLSKHQGYKINKYNTTVAEYAAIHQNFVTEIKAGAKN